MTDITRKLSKLHPLVLHVQSSIRANVVTKFKTYTILTTVKILK